MAILASANQKRNVALDKTTVYPAESANYGISVDFTKTQQQEISHNIPKN
jgi:hypothetical protein